MKTGFVALTTVCAAIGLQDTLIAPLHAKARRVQVVTHTAVTTRKVASVQAAMARFVSILKAGDAKKMLDLFSRGGVAFVNTSHQKLSHVEKRSYEALKEMYLEKVGDNYTVLMKGTIDDPSTDGQRPSFLSVRDLTNAKWKASGLKFSPIAGKAIPQPQKVWVLWARENGTWRIVSIGLPYPVLG